MNRLPRVLRLEIWEYIRGDRKFWKTKFEPVLFDISRYSLMAKRWLPEPEMAVRIRREQAVTQFGVDQIALEREKWPSELKHVQEEIADAANLRRHHVRVFIRFQTTIIELKKLGFKIDELGDSDYMIVW